MRSEGKGTLRVAAYCRVSTDKEDQRNSLAAQQSFFQTYIQEHTDWRLVGIFADEGLSGTSIRRRPQFVEMVRQAMDGEIDLILTKEVSRFARNTVDALQITRQLKACGVGVSFLNDNIDTRDNDGEFRLTIMASVAQEESRKISERTRWGQLQAMRRGVVFGNNSIYGYTLYGGKLTKEPEQAAVVKLVYHKFLVEHKGTHTIARELTANGVSPPSRVCGAWSSTMILRMLRNEKYCGDLLQKKYHTTDHLTHRKVLNDGQEEQVLLQDHHEGIISRQEFEAVQAELNRRAKMRNKKSHFSSRYWYSGKVRCGCCGKSFTMKRTRRTNGTEYTRFVCRGRLDGTGICDMGAVRGEIITTVARHVIQQLPLNKTLIVDHLMAEIMGLHQERANEKEELTRLQQEIERKQDRKDRMLEAYLDGTICREDMLRLKSRWEAELSGLYAHLKRMEEQKENAEQESRRFEEIRTLLERELQGGDALLGELVQQITVYQNYFLVDLVDLPVWFRVRAAGKGTGKQYQIQITECLPVSKGEVT